MLHTVTALERMSLQAMDGSIGMVNDTYFDAHSWALRYFVADTGSWLPGRSVLVSPLSVSCIDWPKFTVILNLTRQQVERKRGIVDVGGQQEQNLRSTGIVTGYSIEAVDGLVGHAQDFLYDERDWALRFIAVDARSWWPGRHVLIAVRWVDDVRWNDCKLRLKLRQDEIREAPQWHPELALAPHDENSIYRYGAQSPGRQPPLGGYVR